ncbi:hypothetical protein FNJ84_13855 [Paracoccus sp. M683]|uniref:hypothetical protein n=1 Tax=Paracoccus sp. M683 TaxID=2594268 RepID=UPI00117D3992|nr:hypothetical protein [Paracoccus sp. M683]TRW95933.1 hypothetical protein FNJ84_13855 [Paracoccus sp. M683]
MSASAVQPSRIRFALLVFAFVYPLVTVGLMILTPLTEGWPLFLRTLILVPIIVIAMVWLIIPLIHTRLRHLL